MTNFLEGCGPMEVKDYLESALGKGFVLIGNSPTSLVRENVITYLGTLAEAARDDFQPYFKQSIELLFAQYAAHQDPLYKHLRGCVIESITIIADSIEKEAFLPYLPTTVDIMLQIMNSNLETVDPQKQFVLTGWQRLTQSYAEEIVPYMDKIMPSIYKIVEKIFAEEGDNVEGGENVNTFQHQEAETAIEMLQAFIERMKENFINYVEDCTKVIPLSLECGGTMKNVQAHRRICTQSDEPSSYSLSLTGVRTAARARAVPPSTISFISKVSGQS